jgi:hypothetical protein
MVLPKNEQINNEKTRNYNKFWEELNVHFPFTVILVSDTTNSNKILVYLHIEVDKALQFWRLQRLYYWWERYIKYTVEMTWYMSSAMKIGSDIQVTLRLVILWAYFYFFKEGQ